MKGLSHMYRATLVSLVCNIALVLIKAVALVLVNSLAIAMDLGISLVGLTVSIILYYSIKLSVQPADLMHNYGYGKVENVCEGMEGVVLIGIALAMSSQAIVGLLHPNPIRLPWVGFGACAVNVMLNFGGAYYIFKMAKKSGSPAIHAEGVHFKLEGVISAMIGVAFIIGITLKAKGFDHLARHVDPLAALVVSICVVIPSAKLAKNSFFKLLDATVEEGSQIEILKQVAKHIGKICDFRELKTRTAGRKKFVEFKIIVPEDISFRRGHDIVSEIEKDIRGNIPHCEVVVRLQPCDKDCTFSRKGERCPYLY